MKICISVIDTIVFSAILSVSLLLILPIRRRSILSLPIILLVFASITAIGIYRKRIIRQQNKRLADEERRFARLIMMKDEEIASLLHTESFYMIRTTHPDLFDFLNAVDSHAATIGIFDRSLLHGSIMSQDLQNRTVLDRHELLNRIEYGTGDREGTERSVKTAILHPFNKYILLAVILFACSFFVRYKIYYRSASCICAFLAPISGFFRDSGPNKNLRIFLDKKGGR